MHYFTHGVNIAAVEDSTQAAKYEHAGWEEVSCDAFIAAWQARDARALSELPTAAVEVAAQPGAIVEPLPTGNVRYSV